MEKQPPHLLLDVSGVGYEVLAPMTSFYNFPALGKELTLHTHMSVSETTHQLFGFYSLEERSLFRLLIKVTGVGPKMALGILSGMDANEFVRCVMNNNVPALVKVPGVGKKTAGRLIIEMRDRLKDWQGGNADEAHSVKPLGQMNHQNILAEAESALVALGYKSAEAAKAVSTVFDQHAVTKSEELIRLALRSMMPK